jgi:hypothetical protein
MTRQWQVIYGYEVPRGTLTVNFPAITPGAPTTSEMVDVTTYRHRVTLEALPRKALFETRENRQIQSSSLLSKYEGFN